MKQAVVIVHGMGEQIPLETLQGFVETVWVKDGSLIDRTRPDSVTGQDRSDNAIWSRPDKRNRSFELRRITTEALDEVQGPTDFFEFYWAHLVHGTTWDHLQAWVFDLLWRSPRRIPPRVRVAWVLLWTISIGVWLCVLAAAIPLSTFGDCILRDCSTGATPQASFWSLVTLPVAVAGGGIFAGTLVSKYLLKYFGDVARYVKASPPNVARRQEIREKGVQLLETLMGRDSDGAGKTAYDRIVVVGHSLGSIVAYDILSHCFARLNTVSALSSKEREACQQPQRAMLEAMLRTAAGLEGVPAAQDTFDGLSPLSIDAFQKQQGNCLTELVAQGSPWIVSDFITLGSPLSHAEFLLAADMAGLRIAQERRILPTCPPAMEYDGMTKKRHFTYRSNQDAIPTDPLSYRLPHHAALFAYTRWTNLYSPHWAILWGDIISGPLADQFAATLDGITIRGIRDIQVLPERDANGNILKRQKIPFFSHTRYWRYPSNWKHGSCAPHHVSELRKALRLKRR